jgi:hypothetical protein
VRLEGEAWTRYFRDFRSSAFRLELHPVYTMPGEADELRRFLAGEKPPPGYHYGWLDTMAAARTAGKTVRRLFDEQTVVKMLYHPDGTQIGRELVPSPDLEAYLGYRDLAWRDAIPFRDYWSARPAR